MKRFDYFLQMMASQAEPLEKAAKATQTSAKVVSAADPALHAA
jgi:hypothetical protein